MFRHILIPTDGSALAAKGARAGLKLARALGAKVSGVYVIQPYLAPVYADVPYLPVRTNSRRSADASHCSPRSGRARR